MTSPWTQGQNSEQEIYAKFVAALGELIREQNLDYEVAMGCLLAFIGTSIAELAQREETFRKGLDIHLRGIRTHANIAWRSKQQEK